MSKIVRAGSSYRKSHVAISIHAAASSRDLERVSQILLLNSTVVNEKDNNGNTPLHCLLSDVCDGETCKSNSALIAKLLLEAGANLNTKNDEGEVPLFLAVRNEWEECAMILLRSGADTTIELKNGKTLALYVAEKMPFAMAELLDDCVRRGQTDQDDADALFVDFRPLLQWPKSESTNELLPPTRNDDTKFLHSLLHISNRTNFFEHPVTELFMRLKYNKLQYIIWFSILLHLVTLAFYTVYIVYLYVVVCAYVRNRKASNCSEQNGLRLEISTTETYGNSSDGCVEKCEKSTAANNMSIALAVFWVIMLVSEGVTLKVKLWDFWEKSKLVWIVAYILMPITLWPSIKENYYINTWRYPAAAGGVLLMWALCIQQLGKIPRLGVYLSMFKKVTIRLVLLACVFTPLLVGYTLGFYVMGALNVHQAYSFMTIISLTVGGPDYNDFFDPDRETSIVYSAVAYTLYFLFIALMCVVFINFLIALTITDVEALWAESEISSKKDQVRFMYLFDRVKFFKFDIFNPEEGQHRNSGVYTLRTKNRPSFIPRTLVRKLKNISNNDENENISSGSKSEISFDRKKLAKDPSSDGMDRLALMNILKELEHQVAELRDGIGADC